MFSAFVGCSRVPPVRLYYGSVRNVHRIPRLSKEKSSEQRPELIETFLRTQEFKGLPIDPWSQVTPTFDLHIPTPWSTIIKQRNLRKGLKFLISDVENYVSNATAMFRLAKAHSLPWSPTVSPWSLQIFRSSSTKPNTWLDPLREIVRDSYEAVNKALAANNVAVVQELSTGEYQKKLLARMRVLHPKIKKQGKGPTPLKPTWRLHSLASPTKCVSIRTMEGHLGKRDPLIGTRFIVQVCMRFDTWQSLTVHGSSKPEPKRVLEYLVFEKKMYYDGPWLMRSQLWEGHLGELQGL